MSTRLLFRLDKKGENNRAPFYNTHRKFGLGRLSTSENPSSLGPRSIHCPDDIPVPHLTFHDGVSAPHSSPSSNSFGNKQSVGYSMVLVGIIYSIQSRRARVTMPSIASSVGCWGPPGVCSCCCRRLFSFLVWDCSPFVAVRPLPVAPHAAYLGRIGSVLGPPGVVAASAGRLWMPRVVAVVSAADRWRIRVDFPVCVARQGNTKHEDIENMHASNERSVRRNSTVR